MHTERAYPNGKLVLIQGDITAQDVHAIVNAANGSLMGGGGVDGAIHRKAGPSLLEACKVVRQHFWPSELPTGEVVATHAGKLPARFVLHTVGPIYRDAGENAPALLASCYQKSLALAHSLGARTIAFPAISTGVYGYPLAEAAPIALQTTLQYTLAFPHAFDEIRMVLFDARAWMVFDTALQSLPSA